MLDETVNGTSPKPKLLNNLYVLTVLVSVSSSASASNISMSDKPTIVTNQNKITMINSTENTTVGKVNAAFKNSIFTP